MGNSEAEAAAKAPKSSTAAQDQPQATSSMPAATAYPDWSSFQAYSPILPHGFFPSPVASSSPAPPFLWGPQGAVPSGMEVDGRSSEGKDKSPLKSLKGSLGSLNMITGKNNNDPGKTSGASANGGFSQSGESGSEASSEGSDANSQNDERELKRQRRKQSNRESARRSRLRKQGSLRDTPREAEDSRLYRNVQYSLDDKHKRPLDSEMEAVKNDTAEGGH